VSKELKIQIVLFLLTAVLTIFNIRDSRNVVEREQALGEAYNSIEDSVQEIRTTENLIQEQLLYLDHIYMTAEEYGVPPEVVLAVMKVESNFNPNAENGRCYGAMQIHDVHCKGFNVKTEELLDLHKNTEVGISLLSDLMESSDSLDAALGKYNMGETGYENWRNSTGKAVTEYTEKVQTILREWKEK